MARGLIERSFNLFLLAAAALTGAACGGGARWSVPLGDLDRVPLGVWGLGPREVFAVGGALGSGGAALLLHFDGAAWTSIPVATDATLWWVFALSPTEVWAVG